MFGRKRKNEDAVGLAGLSAAVAPPSSSPAALAQILSGHGSIGELISQIKAHPQGFRDRMIAQAQAMGVSTYVMIPPGMTPISSPAAADPSAPVRHVDVIDQLTKAADLHDQGALTDAEFEQLKRRLLGT